MHKKRQPTNAGQQRCTSRKQELSDQAAVHASNQDTRVPSIYTRIPHTHHTATCATKAPGCPSVVCGVVAAACTCVVICGAAEPIGLNS